eukprot:TRINITY_DN89814_c0_g1_i1.p1 TRINITY_DN89814_c0_g1~~TRINITY_DN89814_c0_g1_i1.p1  ORF type:complete len:624 (+),score=82.19 TRINITY_DN89814_c0_g1_i1:121-1992(+)
MNTLSSRSDLITRKTVVSQKAAAWSRNDLGKVLKWWEMDKAAAASDIEDLEPKLGWAVSKGKLVSEAEAESSTRPSTAITARLPSSPLTSPHFSISPYLSPVSPRSSSTSPCLFPVSPSASTSSPTLNRPVSRGEPNRPAGIQVKEEADLTLPSVTPHVASISSSSRACSSSTRSRPALNRLRMKVSVEDVRFTSRVVEVHADSLITVLDGTNVKELLRQVPGVQMIAENEQQQNSIRLLGPRHEVNLVFERLRLFLREHNMIVRSIALLPRSLWFIVRSLEQVRSESRARLQVVEDQFYVRIQGNQRQVDHAEELLRKLLYIDFACISAKISRCVVEELFNEDRHRLRSLEASEAVKVEIEEQSHPTVLWATCHITGAKEACLSLYQGIVCFAQHQTGESSLGAVVLEGSGDIKASLAIRTSRARPRIRFLCPGCHASLESLDLLRRHITSDSACVARACVGKCGAYFADAAACSKHESACASVSLCPRCFRAFRSEREVQQHVEQTRCQGGTCPGCGDFSHDDLGLQDHMFCCEQYRDKTRDLAVRRHISELRRELCDHCHFGKQIGRTCERCTLFIHKALLKWQPDKHADDEAVATLVYSFVQEVWEGQQTPNTLPCDGA